jgi:hypothetical protein
MAARGRSRSVSAPRRFDHAEAVERRQAGETLAAIAADYGVTPEAVWQAVKRATDPAWRDRQNDYSRGYQSERYRRPCLRGCGRLSWHGPGRSGICMRCSSLEHATSVRDETLQCTECREWKPDTSFPHAVKRISRRQRHAVCRSCQAAARARTRERHKTPCQLCGKSRLADPRNPDSGLCLDCWRGSRKKAV